MIYTKDNATTVQAKRSNKTIDAEINQISDPEAGTRMKLADSYNDALHQKAGVSTPESVKEAKDIPNACMDAMDVQLGRKTPSGGRLGDPTTQPNAGCLDYKQFDDTAVSPKNPKDFNSKKSF